MTRGIGRILEIARGLEDYQEEGSRLDSRFRAAVGLIGLIKVVERELRVLQRP